MRSSLFVAGLAAAAILVPVAANATTLMANQVSADNQFQMFIATTADNSDGVLVGSDNNWQTFHSFGGALTPGVVNYLHISVFNLAGGSFTNTPPNYGGNPGALFGAFELSDAGFTFANGLQVLLTDTANWTASDVGFGVSQETPVSLGSNDGGMIWNNNTNGGNAFAQIPGETQYIWSDNFCTGCTVYFTAEITPTQITSFAVTDAPEPATTALLAAGLLGLGAGLRRRRGR